MKQAAGKKASAAKAGAKKPSANKAPAKKAKAPAKKAKAPAKKAQVPAKKAQAPANAKKAADQKLRARALEKARKEKEREKAQKEEERARENARREQEKERERALKEKEREKARKEKEREKAQKEKEREKARKEKEREKAQKEKEREKARKEKEREKERARVMAEREAAKEKARLEKEAERERQKAERERQREEARQAKEEERRRKQDERERQREEARRAKEEERSKREAEREAYRKAKEAERERLRAEREAARRALEGKVARATRQAQRAGGFGARGATSRMYRPSAIPNQSGTTRRVESELDEQLAQARLADRGGIPTDLLAAVPAMEEMPPEPQPEEASVTLDSESANPVPEQAEMPPTGSDSPTSASQQSPSNQPGESQQPVTVSVEARYASIVERLEQADEKFRRDYRESFDMSWIYHDSALEGVVYTFPELQTAIDPNITVVPDSSLQPVCEEIRRHKLAIDMIRDLAEKKRTPVTVDVVKKIYLTLHPEEGDIKSVKYRKDIPQHRLYFHEYAPPDKIAHKARQVIDWLNGPEPRKIRHPVRIAARVHFDLLRVFPFPSDSGKVARLLMNLLLLRSDYPPAIIHSTERQRYYEALKGSLPTVVQMVNESIQNGLQSVEKKLDEQETRKRTFGS